MYCSKCGKENNEDSNFCVHCGQKLTQSTNLSETPHHHKNVILQDANCIPCKGMISNGKILSSSGVGTINEIIIKSFWKDRVIRSKCSVLFDYNPNTKEAFNIREYPIGLGLGENNRIEIKGGSYKEGTYYIVGNGHGLRSETTDFIGLYNAKISVITAERAQQKLKSLAIGAVGTLATLGVGLVAGALHASKKYNTIEVETENGGFFIAQCRPQAYQTLYTAIKSNQNDINNFEAEEAYTKSPNCKNIEYFFPTTNTKEIAWNVVSYGFIGLIALSALSKCSQ